MGLYSAAFKVAQGYAQKSAMDSAATELSQEAGQSVAAGIQGQEAQLRRSNYIAGNAQARIASGGLSTTGASAQKVIGGIKGQGEYEGLVQLYQGEDRASELNYRATQLRNQGDNAVAGGLINGATSVLSGGGPQSFFAKYASTPLFTSQYSGGFGGGGTPDFVNE
jgi:hypothetical protein